MTVLERHHHGPRLTADLSESQHLLVEVIHHDLGLEPDACDKRPGRVSSLSLVRYKGNDYSVPVAYGHREVLIRGYVERVVISCAAEVIARHKRSYEREDLVFDPLHYLPLIERKVGALDQAAPLRGWDLPEVFATLRRLLEARMGPRNHGAAGKREYVQGPCVSWRASRSARSRPPCARP